MNKFKLITYIDRINVFSDTFFKHYLKIFNPEEFYVITYTETLDVVKPYLKSFGVKEDSIHVINRNKFGFGENVSLQNRLKQIFLDKGFIVIYADVDEMIWHPDLKEYIKTSPQFFFCAKGFQIVQNDGEGFLDVSRPILEQRQWCQPDYDYYSKVCILKRDFSWTGGRHNKGTIKVDDSIYLIDLGKVCKKLMIDNNTQTTSLYKGVMERYRIKSMEILEREYKQYLKKIEKIPETIIENKLF